jgi:hypothetical protein
MITEHGRSNDRGQAPTWKEIERHLVGLADLTDLIDRLSGGDSQPPGALPAILDVLGEHLRDVLDQGLVAAPSDALDTLLRHPRLLRDLQGLIFTAGGEYWTTQIDQAASQLPAEFQAMIDRAREELKDSLEGT